LFSSQISILEKKLKIIKLYIYIYIYILNRLLNRKKQKVQAQNKFYQLNQLQIWRANIKSIFKKIYLFNCESWIEKNFS